MTDIEQNDLHGGSWLTTVRVSGESGRVADVKYLHGVVVGAALSGEVLRPVLWAAPTPRMLVVRHDRRIEAAEWPLGFAEDVTHHPYWWPPGGARIEAAVVMDASQSGETVAQWQRRAGRAPGPLRRRPSRVRTGAKMAEVLSEVLSGVLEDMEVRAVRSWHARGRRQDRVQHTNPVLLRLAGTVSDEAGMHAIMRAGVGRARSFGCGLFIARPGQGAS